MLGIILGVVGLAGGGGIVALIAKFGLKAVLGGAGSYFKRVPRWVWIAFAVAVAAVALVIWHGHRMKAHDKALEARVTAQVNARWLAGVERLRQQAHALRVKAEDHAAQINTALKGQHDEEVRHIVSDAAGLRLRGPGIAAAQACSGPGGAAGFPVGPGRHESAGQPAGASPGQVPAANGLPGLPAERFAVVPWSWLVDTAAQCDVSRSENLTWRSWREQQAAAWEDYRRKLQAAAGQAQQSTPRTEGTNDGRRP
jgi:hypothetical protein